MKRSLSFFAALLFVFASTGCANKVPPTLSPQAKVAFVGTSIIKNLDLLRDIAVDANAQKPPLLPEATTRAVVNYHTSAIKLVHEAPNGWKAEVSTGADELLKNLPKEQRQLLAPYVRLVQTVLKEVLR